ncbi:hypothetical protein AKUH3B101J_09000 [Apilactobacillus kunkeei]|nr:hypothetical protein AKUH3B104J_09000 [Apilactobacillus kunkeei]CAI2615211.1 hypothetical protein AKUH3B101J_09000 [Apilactobacillus kunkeei]
MESTSNMFNDFLNKHTTVTDEKCSKHNVNKIIFDVSKGQSFCPICQKNQHETKEKELTIKYTNQIKKRRTSKVLTKDSIMTDSDLEDATFDNFEVTNDEQKQALHVAKQSAYQYLKKDNQFNTLLTGEPGRGKSHLALSMLKAVNDTTEKPQSCLFVSVDELFRRIKDSFNYSDNKYSEGNMVRLLTNVDLLVLDDLGSEASMNRDKSASDFVQKILFGILNARSRTIITTNLNAKELEAMYNPKLVSRMEKGVQGHLIKFTEKTKDKRLVDF